MPSASRSSPTNRPTATAVRAARVTIAPGRIPGRARSRLVVDRSARTDTGQPAWPLRRAVRLAVGIADAVRVVPVRRAGERRAHEHHADRNRARAIQEVARDADLRALRVAGANDEQDLVDLRRNAQRVAHRAD